MEKSVIVELFVHTRKKLFKLEEQNLELKEKLTKTEDFLKTVAEMLEIEKVKSFNIRNFICSKFD